MKSTVFSYVLVAVLVVVAALVVYTVARADCTARFEYECEHGPNYAELDRQTRERHQMEAGQERQPGEEVPWVRDNLLPYLNVPCEQSLDPDQCSFPTAEPIPSPEPTPECPDPDVAPSPGDCF